jgi:hypothetical protein
MVFIQILVLYSVNLLFMGIALGSRKPVAVQG